ncbi:trigger factor [Desulfohalovibrio reitneri]|uniref:trigger factor n=1 Tax=Desulfohalovibrio reitneri TaxID=1307759 RepID=UPI0004A75712|nr:trigger factor [Desulfohalovibrio reitneri]
MDYKVEDLTPTEKKVNVTVPAEEVNAALSATTAIYGRSADIKGFRKGKVPSSVVETKFKKQILAEATQDLVNYHINEIMSELKLSPMSGIQVDSDTVEKGEEFTYSFTFEVPPALELPEYKGLEVEQEAVEADENEVDQVVERIRANMAELKDVEETREARDGDTVMVDFAALSDDKAFEGLKSNNFQLELGQGQALEAFEDLVKGLKPGEQNSGEITFPEDFLNEDLAGKTAEMRVYLRGIKEKVLPEVNDELAVKAGGFESVAAMREAITESYLQSRRQLVQSVAQKDLLDKLMRDMEIPLPKTLVDRYLDQLVQDHVQKLERKGKSLASTGKSTEDLQEEYRPQAEEAARTQVFLMAVANKEEMTVSPEEIDGEMRRMAMQSGQDYGQLKEYAEQTGLHVLIKDRLLADKAMQMIYENAEVTEVPAGSKSSESEEQSGEEG